MVLQQNEKHVSYNSTNRSAIIFIYLFINRSVNKKLGCNFIF